MFDLTIKRFPLVTTTKSPALRLRNRNAGVTGIAPSSWTEESQGDLEKCCDRKPWVDFGGLEIQKDH